MNLFDFNLTLPITDPTWVFFLVLIIILFAPMILGRLHIPHIIGMILAGVLIGEHGFHVLDRDSSFELFGKSRTILYHVPCRTRNGHGKTSKKKPDEKALCSVGSLFLFQWDWVSGVV